MAGTLTVSTISDGTNSTSSTNCIQGSAKAWVNYNVSSGSSAPIRASYNVSSVTYNSTGVSTVNFTNAFADANYVTVLTSRPTSDVAYNLAYIAPTNYGNYTASSMVVRTAWTNAGQNPDIVCASFFR